MNVSHDMSLSRMLWDTTCSFCLCATLTRSLRSGLTPASTGHAVAKGNRKERDAKQGKQCTGWHVCHTKGKARQPLHPRRDWAVRVFTFLLSLLPVSGTQEQQAKSFAALPLSPQPSSTRICKKKRRVFGQTVALCSWSDAFQGGPCHGPCPPVPSLQAAGYGGPGCPLETSAVSPATCEILTLLKARNLPLASIQWGIASCLRKRKEKKKVGRAY